MPASLWVNARLAGGVGGWRVLPRNECGIRMSQNRFVQLMMSELCWSIRVPHHDLSRIDFALAQDTDEFMNLTPPSLPIFFISVIMVALVVAAKYFGTNIPVLSPIVNKSMFEVLLVAYALLFAGVVFRRL